MARVRLRVWENIPSLHVPAGVPVTLPFLRVVVTAVLGPDPPPGVVAYRHNTTAVLDTGAPFNVINGGSWELYERLGLLTRLVTPVGAAPLNIAGAQCGYELGRMWVGFADADFQSRPHLPILPAVPVVFQLLTTRNLNLEHPIILGLSGGALDRRRLFRDSIQPRPSSVNRRDSGPRYGQEWYVED